ncbi:MAG: cytochrome c oxidase subunit II [Actinobacteria bacterium]|uniref:cytochrome-c oxidase n=1 Tax=freshwater metagenome TaxID=449393 RepID=A0A6J7LQ62_9ZZZZ|nr:cytochrome c oxidase subunit II [Actinomycetota bacterium]
MTDTAVHQTEDPPAPEPPGWKRPEVRSIALIWLVLTIVGECLVWIPSWLMGPSASTQMDDIKQTMTLFTAMSAPVAAVIWAIMIYSVARWRYTGDEPPEDDAPDFRTNSPVVLLWSILSGVLTLVVFIWGMLKIAAIPAAGGLAALPAGAMPPMVVEVTGNQWVWNFTYPELGNIQSDVLYLPLDRTTLFDVTSADVIHSFWIVEMGVKVDATPGQLTKTDVVPHSIGSFDVRCAELCGLLHAAMETQAKVVTQEEFDAWAQDKGAEVPIEPAAQEEGGA